MDLVPTSDREEHFKFLVNLYCEVKRKQLEPEEPLQANKWFNFESVFIAIFVVIYFVIKTIILCLNKPKRPVNKPVSKPVNYTSSSLV